jgi:hypothetical protein
MLAPDLSRKPRRRSEAGSACAPAGPGDVFLLPDALILS